MRKRRLKKTEDWKIDGKKEASEDKIKRNRIRKW